jgi:hypothetical protein
MCSVGLIGSRRLVQWSPCAPLLDESVQLHDRPGCQPQPVTPAFSSQMKLLWVTQPTYAEWNKQRGGYGYCGRQNI